MNLTIETSTGSETLQQIFGITDKDLASGITQDRLLNATQDDRDGLGKRLGDASWASVSEGLASHLTTFLQQDLAGVFVGCWSKYNELQKCADDSRKDPSSTVEVTLAEHTFTWEMSPSIEIRLDGAPLTNIPFGISFVFDVSALQLGLKAGCIQAIHAGKCDCRGEIACGEQTIWSKALAGIDLPGKLNLIHPVPLANPASIER